MGEVIKVRRRVTLAELPDGRWLFREHGVYYTTPGRALAAINRDNANTAKGGKVMVVTSITYKPCSDAGTALVRKLVAKEA